jgi:O-antigen ligase
MALPNIFLGVSLFLFLYMIIKKEINFYFTNQIIVFGFFLLFLIGKQLIQTKFNFEDSKFYSNFLIIFILPILLQTFSKTKTAIAIVIASLIAILVALYNTIIYFFENKIIPFANDEAVNKILVIDRPYLGFFCLIAIISNFYLIKMNPKYKMVLLFISFSLFLFIVLIVARLSLITLILLGLIYLFFYSTLLFYKKILILATSIFIISITLHSYKNMSKRFFTNTSLERIKLYDPRVDIWDCAYRISKESDFNIILGSKSHQLISDKLVACYKTKSENDLQRRQWFVDTRFNTHNQFIDFFLVGGLIGLGLFLYFIYEIIRASKNNFYSFSLVISLLLFLTFENVFQRQLGCYFIAVILSFNLNQNNLSNLKFYIQSRL